MKWVLLFASAVALVRERRWAGVVLGSYAAVGLLWIGVNIVLTTMAIELLRWPELKSTCWGKLWHEIAVSGAGTALNCAVAVLASRYHRMLGQLRARGQ
jgi:hypothetical protein